MLSPGIIYLEGFYSQMKMPSAFPSMRYVDPFTTLVYGQFVQNMCCRIIKNLRKYDHISDAVKDLHWLKIPQHIHFKILVTIYQCVSGMAPQFLINLLDLNFTRNNLRSNTQGKLPIPRCSLV